MKAMWKTVLLNTLPVMAGYLVLGFGFGVIGVESGVGIWWVLAMSVFVYAGSMQYVAVSLLTSGASLVTASLTTLMVNARHLFYGISMIAPYKKAGKYKPYLMFALTDETYSLVCTEDAEKDGFHRYAFFVSLVNQCYWVAGSLLGALVGTLVTFNTAGVEFAMTALFITVFTEQWKTTRDHLPALIGVGVSALCLLIFGAQRFLIPSMLVISFVLSLCRKQLLKGEKTR